MPLPQQGQNAQETRTRHLALIVLSLAAASLTLLNVKAQPYPFYQI
jgi:hypothetical protein